MFSTEPSRPLLPRSLTKKFSIVKFPTDRPGCHFFSVALALDDVARALQVRQFVRVQSSIFDRVRIKSFPKEDGSVHRHCPCAYGSDRFLSFLARYNRSVDWFFTERIAIS